jgi:hypothetical protein
MCIQYLYYIIDLEKDKENEGGKKKKGEYIKTNKKCKKVAERCA